MDGLDVYVVYLSQSFRYIYWSPNSEFQSLFVGDNARLAYPPVHIPLNEGIMMTSTVLPPREWWWYKLSRHLKESTTVCLVPILSHTCHVGLSWISH